MNREQAEEIGHAVFNSCDHICIDLPDATTTLSVRSPDGNKVTFAFVQRCDGKGHQCVDIQHHTPEAFTTQGDRNLPIQSALFLGPGPTNALCKIDDDSPTTLVVLKL